MKIRTLKSHHCQQVGQIDEFDVMPRGITITIGEAIDYGIIEIVNERKEKKSVNKIVESLEELIKAVKSL